MSDDESTPMTRTELAMLWDGLNRWLACHYPAGQGPGLCDGAEAILADIDTELQNRFGG